MVCIYLYIFVYIYVYPQLGRIFTYILHCIGLRHSEFFKLLKVRGMCRAIHCLAKLQGAVTCCLVVMNDISAAPVLQPSGRFY